MGERAEVLVPAVPAGCPEGVVVAEFAVDTPALRVAADRVASLTTLVDAAAAAVPARLMRAGEPLGGSACGALVPQLALVVASALAGLSTALVELRHGLAAGAESYEAAEASATARSAGSPAPVPAPLPPTGAVVTAGRP